ncbi:hypothetical protein RJ641_013878 [Dillenia turbinata]|uniref:Disease resistance R13L4/SHOC-2-like LRR domain-containing protein n=1 Tax=Dillenia turbinata TaxID=194707 RepID=A0AAN8ZLU1_9MAGN
MDKIKQKCWKAISFEVLELWKSEWKTVCTNLPLLRYFRLAGCGGLLKFPHSFGNLRSLQTLDVRESILGDLSSYAQAKVVQKMEQLRYVRFGSRWIGDTDFEVGGLKNLQCLKYVVAGDWMARDLSYLTNLQKLGIYCISTVEQLRVVLEISDRLQSLHLDNGEILAVSPIQPHQAILIRVRSVGARSNGGPREASVLEIPSAWQGFIQGDPNDLLCKWFSETPTSSNFTSAGIRGMESSRRGPQLKHLEIWSCWKLRMIPEGLKFITTIQELEIRDMPKEFEERVRKVDGRRDVEATSDPHQGADYCKIRHIPTLNIISSPLQPRS